MSVLSLTFVFLFFFNDTATPEIYTLSLHDALPICTSRGSTAPAPVPCWHPECRSRRSRRIPCAGSAGTRSEEHTSELQSQFHLVCRLLLEKKKKKQVMLKSL